MTTPESCRPPAGLHHGMAEFLAGEGLAPQSVEALLDFDVANFQWVRQVARGDLSASILSRLGLGVDPALFQGMTALLRVRQGVGRAPAEPTIGLLAEEMAVDPSRASRIAADLVARGLVRRDAAQDDGRKSVLSLTPEGWRVLDAYRREKWRVLARVFVDWPAAEVAAFAASVRRYSRAMQAASAALRDDAAALDAGGGS